MSLIRLVDITKRFGKITALDQVNLSVEDGEYVCVLGPTGAGKTTLLRIIAGLLHPDQGEIYIEGRLVNGVSPEDRNTVYMFQQYALFPNMNVWQNVSYGPTIKNWDNDRIDTLTREILEMVRLGERRDAYPHELSGGMQQRVALGRGIASGARILLLDEPLGALDARLRVDLRALLRSLVKDQGLTAIHVTHDQEEALMIGDRIVVLRNGTIEQIGSPHEIFSRPRSIFVANFVGGANFIEGSITQHDNERTIIEISGGLQIYANKSELLVGDKVVIAFRLEDTIVGKNVSDGSNNLWGRINTAMFIGGSMEYDIILENGVQVSSKVLIYEEFRPFEPGERVVISFRPNECYVFPYPDTGLLKEIEAI